MHLRGLRSERSARGTEQGGWFARSGDDLLTEFSGRLGEWAGLGSPRELFQQAAGFLVAHLPVDVLSLGLADGDRLALAVWSVSGGAAAPVQEVVVGIDDGNAVAAAARARGLVRRTGPSGVGRSRWSEAGVVAVPLMVGDRVVGAISLESRLAPVPVDDDLLMVIGFQLGMAVEHARMVGGMERSLRQTVTVLAALVEERDAYTEAHCEHLAEMALAIGVRMGLPAARLDLLTYGGLLHDIGKVSLPDAVLLKAGPLDAGEFSRMKTHASVGEEVLGRIEALREVAPIVGQHHERFDGGGYPRGLRGEEIMLEARILSVVDAFDAMTSTRPYRAALPWQEATEEIRAGFGSQFDPDVAGVLLRYLEGEEAQWKHPGL